MWFWAVAALLTLGASLAILLPMLRAEGRAAAADAYDIEVYRDQLSELDRDAGRGLIRPAEAEEARTEIARRILRAGKKEKSNATVRSRSGRLLAGAAVLAVPLISWSFYGVLGSPDLPPEPLAARLTKNPASSTIDELVARAEHHLAEAPSDVRGWEVLAPIYVRMSRFADAANAYRTAIRLDGSSAAREAGLGEALTAEQGGMVSAQAETAFEKALALDPENAKARFFLATAQAQEGKAEEAVKGWSTLLIDLPPNSPWRAAAEQALAAVDKKPAAMPGPTQDQMAAASSMSAGDRAAMIETMVSRLDGELRKNPDNPDGWMRLVRSYLVLGKKVEAEDARRRGVEALGADSNGAKELDKFAASLGLARTE
ncbi:MAG: c-type cytochrome biogenesis protein CcmI [Hyphomicrobiales bacterium]|nr:c-type cytochrome biogenesis protein CcmI [Hyphomicrobiales bacterium]